MPTIECFSMVQKGMMFWTKEHITSNMVRQWEYSSECKHNFTQLPKHFQFRVAEVKTFGESWVQLKNDGGGFTLKLSAEEFMQLFVNLN